MIIARERETRERDMRGTEGEGQHPHNIHTHIHTYIHIEHTHICIYTFTTLHDQIEREVEGVERERTERSLQQPIFIYIHTHVTRAPNQREEL